MKPPPEDAEDIEIQAPLSEADAEAEVVIPGETKRQRSLRLAKYRGDTLLHRIELFSNLSRSDYEFEPEFLEQMLDLLTREFDLMLASFKSDEERAPRKEFGALFE